MLKTVMRSGTGASIRQWGLHPVVAGKTGTTNDQKDAWFVGYTPDFICLVWVGYDDNTPVGMTGGQAALPIWARFMKRIESRLPVRDFPRPAGIVEKMIDPYTGKLASDSCTNGVRELFIKGTEPLRECSESDHYLPIEYFLGPEPRIQQAFYTDETYTNQEYANISYDNNRYAYTNYEDESDNEHGSESGSVETIDYSDVSFPEETEEPNADNLTPVDQTEAVGEIPEYTGSVLNDYEAASTQEIDDRGMGQDSTTTDQDLAPAYIAPKPVNKKIPVYTNKDITPADSPDQPEDENEDSDESDQH
jgi:membrane peptidoglycan carboxypeptidase